MVRIRESDEDKRSPPPGAIHFTVFDAKSRSGGNASNDALLQQLTQKGRVAGLKIDQSALAYRQSGRARYYGSKNLIDYLSRTVVLRWTHKIDA